MFIRCATLATVSAVLVALAASARADAPDSFDVAENPTRASFGTVTAFPANLRPRIRVRSFAQSGYIYPVGTLSDGISGVTPEGGPSFPDKVLGTWSNSGWYLTDGRQATTGMQTITRQVFSFRGGDSVITLGPLQTGQSDGRNQPIVGGAGTFARTGGHIVQTSLGTAGPESISFRFKILTTDGDP